MKINSIYSLILKINLIIIYNNNINIWPVWLYIKKLILKNYYLLFSSEKNNKNSIKIISYIYRKFVFKMKNKSLVLHSYEILHKIFMLFNEQIKNNL